MNIWGAIAIGVVFALGAYFYEAPSWAVYAVGMQAYLTALFSS